MEILNTKVWITENVYFNSDVSLSEDQYALYGGKSGRIPRNAAGQIYDPTR